MKALCLTCLIAMFCQFWVVPARAESTPESLIIDDFECVGNLRTNCDIVTREIFLAKGDKVSESEIENSRIRLLLSGLFRDVNISLKKSSEYGHVVVLITLDELSPYFTELSNTFQSRYGSNYDSLLVRVGTRNLFGLGKLLSFAAGSSIGNITNSPVYLLQYQDPHLFGSYRYFFLADAEYRKFESSGNFVGSIIQDYRIEVGRRIFDFGFMSIGQRLSVTQYDSFDYFGYNYEQYNNARRTTLLAAGWNSENDPYLPTEGSKARFQLEIDSVNSASTFITIDLGYERLFHLAPNQILSFEIGTRTGDLKSESFNAYFDPVVTYSYDLERGQTGAIRNSRLNLSVTPEGYGGHWFGARLGLGVKIDSPSFGFLALNIFGSVGAPGNRL